MIDNKMPFSRSLLWILVTTLLISGSAFMGWLYFLHNRDRRLHDDQYRIVAIIQSTPHADALKTLYLAELLDLSLDRPINLYQFNINNGVLALLKNPLIKNASIKKILPGTLFIHYELRLPFAYVGDVTNTVIDQEGYLFPFRPFFTPKHLPTIYLGLSEGACKWGNCLKDEPSVNLAFSILREIEQLPQKNLHIKQLDVTQAQSDSYGQRQVVLVTEEKRQDKTSSSNPLIFLRLSTNHIAQDLTNFQTLRNELFKKNEGLLAKLQKESSQALIVDLRIPHLAFIKACH